MLEKYTWRVEGSVARDIAAIAAKERTSTAKVVEDALKFYRDRYYMDTKATFLSQEILSSMQSTVDAMEHRINNRSNQLLSSMAIQLFILDKIMADNLEIAPEGVELYRAQAVEFLRANNRVLNLKEVLE